MQTQVICWIGIKPLKAQSNQIQQALMSKGQEAETGHEAYRRASLQMGGMPQATDFLAKEGIPGIKYLDQMSRDARQGSSNYVIFNDKLIDIMRKYGLAGLAPLAGAGAIAGQPQGQPQQRF